MAGHLGATYGFGITGVAAVLLLLLSPSMPLDAQAPGGGSNAVDVALILAVDASGSVDDDRFELQKRGFAAAIRNPKIVNAIRAGDHRAIAVFMVQWTGPPQQDVMVPWTYVNDEFSAGRVAAAIEAAPRRLMGGGTSISGAIDYSVQALATSPYRATRKVIDISGDGANNIGRPAEAARDEAVAQGIRINGLPILTVEPDLDQYYRKNVIGGPGAFAIVAKTYDEYADAILRKLVTEISQDAKRGALPSPGVIPGARDTRAGREPIKGASAPQKSFIRAADAARDGSPSLALLPQGSPGMTIVGVAE